MGTYNNLNNRHEFCKCEFCEQQGLCVVWIDLYDHTHSMCLKCIEQTKNELRLFLIKNNQKL